MRHRPQPNGWIGRIVLFGRTEHACRRADVHRPRGGPSRTSDESASIYGPVRQRAGGHVPHGPFGNFFGDGAASGTTDYGDS